MISKLLGLRFSPALVAVCILAFMAACQSVPEINHADMQTGMIPETRPFTLPPAKKIQWLEYPEDSLPKKTVLKLNLHQLPSRPFSANEFKPLKQPVSKISFDRHLLESQDLNLEALPHSTVPYKKFLLPEPQVTPASAPALPGKGTAGLTRLGQIEGLPGIKVHSMVEDAEGNAWIATERGLIKYTGTEFLNYNILGRDQTGGIEIVKNMVLDADGHLVISGYVSGIFRIDIVSGIAEQFALPQGLYWFTLDHQGNIWGSAINVGVFRFDMKSRRLTKIPVSIEGTDSSRVYAVSADSKGNIWIGFRHHIGIIDPAFSKMQMIGPKEGLDVLRVIDFTEDAKGKVWLSSYSPGAISISLQDQTLFRLGADQGVGGSVFNTIMDTKNRLWLICSDTIFIYDEKKEVLKKQVTDAPLEAFSSFPSSGMKDSRGNIWIGTNFDGILLADPNGMLADHFTDRDGLESNDIWGVEEDSKGRIWMAHYRGLHIYDPKAEKLYLLKLPASVNGNDNRQLRKIGPDMFFMGSVRGFSIIDISANTITHYNTGWNRISDINFRGFTDENGTIWFCGQGLFTFSPVTNTYKEFNERNGLVSGIVYIVEKDDRGRIWLCTERGVVLINPEEDTYQTIGEADGLNGNSWSMYMQAKSGDHYLGGDNGVSILDRDLSKITNINTSHGLKPPVVFDMVEWNNQIYMGTENGLVLIDKPAKPDQPWHFYNYSKAAGFPYNDYNQSTAKVTSYGNTWWAASPVLTVVHQRPSVDNKPPIVRIKGIRIMDRPSGFFKPSALKKELLTGDTVWIGNIAYSADALPQDSGHLKEMNIRWDSTRTSFRVPVGLNLPHNQNSFNFSFINQNPSSTDKKVYRYILEGADEGWSEITAKTVSHIYYNIKPGDYTFKVIARGLNGVWSSPDELSFTVRPPWWQTWWAFIIYVLSATALIYIIVRSRSKMLERENKLLEKKIQLRTKALHEKMEELKSTQTQLIHSEKMASLGELTAGIAHEIQNPLNFINNFAEINQELLAEIEEELNRGNFENVKLIAGDININEAKIYHHGRRADAIVKNMLQHSRITGNLIKEQTDINKLADEYLRLAFHGLRAKDKSFNATLKTDLDQSLPPVGVVPQEIGRALLNLLTNAFYAVNERGKLKEPGYVPTVTISTSRSDNSVVIEVADNGNGIPDNMISKIFQPFFTTKPTGQGTGLGLSMCYDIITKAHGGELKVESREGEGTKFSIVLPM